MLIFKSLVDGVVEVAVVHLVGLHPRRSLRELIEFAAQVLTLLMSALRRSGQGSKFTINLKQQLMQFAKIQRPALVLVVLLEELVQPSQMVACLREPFLDPLRDSAPFFEGDDHFFGVFALFVGEGAEEGDEVVGDVVLDGGAVADGVDGA